MKEETISLGSSLFEDGYLRWRDSFIIFLSRGAFTPLLYKYDFFMKKRTLSMLEIH